MCDLLLNGEFLEVYVNILFDVCEVCDLKGLYKKVCVGEIC